MIGPRRKLHPALKHAGYSATSVLPGESAAEFANLHRDLMVEFAPHGAMEEEIVRTIAHCLWRRRNLATFRIAERVQDLMRDLPVAVARAASADLPRSDQTVKPKRSFADKMRAAEHRLREDVGELYAFIEMGEEATVQGLEEELEVQSRLDAMIDHCIKRLLLVRGLKSMSTGSTSTPSLPSPSKAA